MGAYVAVRLTRQDEGRKHSFFSWFMHKETLGEQQVVNSSFSQKRAGRIFFVDAGCNLVRSVMWVHHSSYWVEEAEQWAGPLRKFYQGVQSLFGAPSLLHESICFYPLQFYVMSL